MKVLLCVVSALLLAGCQRNPPAQSAKEYQMQGEVVALDPAAQETWMEAQKDALRRGAWMRRYRRSLAISRFLKWRTITLPCVVVIAIWTVGETS